MEKEFWQSRYFEVKEQVEELEKQTVNVLLIEIENRINQLRTKEESGVYYYESYAHKQECDELIRLSEGIKSFTSLK